MKLFNYARLHSLFFLFYFLFQTSMVYTSWSLEEQALIFTPQENSDLKWKITSNLHNEHLSNKYVTFIDFLNDGSAWISTSDGLYLYNGYTWKKFSVLDGLPSNFVRCVFIASDGRIWFGTDHGAGVYDGETFNTFDVKDGLAGSNVRRIVEDPDGVLWFCCDQWPDASIKGGLSSYHNGKWKTYNPANGLPSYHVTNLFQDSEGRQYALTINGLFQKHGNNWIDILKQSGYKNHSVITSMAESAQHGIFAINSNELFYQKHGQWRRYSFQYKGQYSYIFSTKNGDIITLGRSGINQSSFYKWTGAGFQQISSNFNQPTNTISTISESPDGSIWCCGYDYLVKWDRNYGEWNKINNLPKPKFLDNQNRLWFISTKKTVRFDGEKWYRIKKFPKSSAIDLNGNVWGWSKSNLHCWAKDKIHDYSIESVGIKQIKGMHQDAQGRQWFYGLNDDNNTVTYFDGSSWTHVDNTEIQNGHILQGFADPKSGLWYLIGDIHNDYLRLIKSDVDKITTINFNPGVHAFDDPFFIVDNKGGIWLYSRFSIYYIDPQKTDSWQLINGFPGKNIFSAIAKEDEVWFGSDGIIGGKGGLSRLHNGKITNFDLDVCNFGSKASDGTIYFGGYTNFFCIPHSPESKPRQISLPSEGLVTSVVQGPNGKLWLSVGQSTLCYSPDKISPETIITKTNARLNQSQQFFPILSAVSRFKHRNNLENYHYSWRIDNQPWSAFDSSNKLRIPLHNLSTGIHTLHAKAKDEGGDIDPTAAMQNFYVYPVPFQDKPWFWPVVFIVFILIFLFAVLAFVARRKLTINLHNMEKIVNQRTKALRENEERLLNLIETSNDWIWEIDENLTYTYSSSKVRNILGFEPEELVGNSIYDFVSHEDRKRLTTQITKALQNPEPYSYLQHAKVHKNGSYVTIESNGIPLFDQQGAFCGYRGINHDISNLKKAETEKLELEQQLNHSQKMEAIGELAGGVSHDFNNLLTIIIGNIELAQLKADSSIHVYLKNMKDATSRASSLVKQLLTFSRKSRIELKPIDINKIVGDTFHLIRETIDRRIDIEVHTETDRSSTLADISQLNSILMNCCINARDAIIEVMRGKLGDQRKNDYFIITIQTESVQIDQNYCQKHALAHEGEFIVLSITDNGIGMDQQTQNRIFEPFFTTKETGQGTGLGLANAYGIVNQHDGWIELESEYGQGSEIKFYLPITTEKMTPVQDEIKQVVTGGNETILFIDDEKLIRRLNRSILEDAGYTVITASDGEEGLEFFYLEKDKIDLVLLDFSMPNLSGAEVAERILEISPKTKIIICSGYIQEWQFASLTKIGIAGFLDKPYRQDILLQKIEDTINP